ncbi:MAG: hypothetical protein KatS3mg105_1229 [Gemmatales bacterium]|nr:MAG: hypothetical protein KatS3mg105_1229 [Gemmatales bacterium]
MIGRSLLNTGFFVAVFSAGVALYAQAPQGRQYLDQYRRLQAIQAQKVLYEVRNALRVAENAALTDPQRAVAILKRAAQAVENETALSKEQRTSMANMLRSRIRSIEAGPDKNALSEKQLQLAIQEQQKKQRTEKDLKLSKDLQTLQELTSKGKLAEARQLAVQLAKEHPSNPAVVAAYQTAVSYDQLVTAKNLTREKNDRTLGVIRDIERSALPPKGDIEFPKDWKERMKLRDKFRVDRPQLTSQERRILQSLQMVLPTVSFRNDRFEDVIQYLSTRMGQPILIDKQAMEDAGLTYDTPVSLAAKNVTVRTVLRKILADHGLAYVIKDQAIQVTTAAKARNMMTVRAYYLGDLLGAGGGPGDPLTSIYGPGIGPIQRMQNVAAIIDLIQTTIDPGSWSSQGGPGSIFFHYPTMSLVIKQSAEVHSMIGANFLGR